MRVLPVIFRFENPPEPASLSRPAGRCLCRRTVAAAGCRLRQRCAVAALSGVLCCCAVGPNFVHPKAPPVTHYIYGQRSARDRRGAGHSAALHCRGEAAGGLVAPVQLREARCDRGRGAGGQSRPRGRAGEPASSEDNLRSGYGIFFPQVEADAAATRAAVLGAAVRPGGCTVHRLQPVHAVGSASTTRSTCSAGSGGWSKPRGAGRSAARQRAGHLPDAGVQHRQHGDCRRGLSRRDRGDAAADRAAGASR